MSSACSAARSPSLVNLLSRRLALVAALFAATGPVLAQAIKPQVWTTNVVPGEFPSQAAALAAVRAKGGIYALAERVEGVQQTTDLTTFVYGAAPRDASVGAWKYDYTHADPGLSSEGAAMASSLANLQAQSPTCQLVSIEPTDNWATGRWWYNGASYYEVRHYRIHNVDPVYCSEYFPVNGIRERVVECPNGLTWDSAEKACEKHDIARISSKPQPCSKCDYYHNPVSVSTGDKFQEETDFTLPWLTLSRSYHSAFDVPGARLGAGWTHSLNIRLFQNGSSGAGLVMPQGEVLPFNYSWEGYEAIDGSGRRIQSINGAYMLEEAQRSLNFAYDGTLTKIDYLSGDSLSFEYDEIGRLIKVSNSSGRSVSFEYDDANELRAAAKLLAITSDGVVLVSYEYDSAGRLEYANYPDGSARRYHYEDSAYPDYLTGITDENGVRFATFGYNADGLAVLSEHAGGLYRGTVDYQSNGSTVYADADGRIQTFNFTTDGVYRKITQVGDVAGAESTTYAPVNSGDFRRRPINRTDKRGIQTAYVYTDLSDAALGKVRRTTTNEAVGKSEARTIETWRDWYSTRLLKMTEPGREELYQRNGRGQPISVTVKDTAAE